MKKVFKGNINGEEYTDPKEFFNKLDSIEDCENLSMSYAYEEQLDEKVDPDYSKETTSNEAVKEKELIDKLDEMYDFEDIDETIINYPDLEDFRKSNERYTECLRKVNDRILDLLKNESMDEQIEQHCNNISNTILKIKQMDDVNNKKIVDLKKQRYQLQEELTLTENKISTCEKANIILGELFGRFNSLLDDTKKYINNFIPEVKGKEVKKQKESGIYRLAKLVGLL